MAPKAEILEPTPQNLLKAADALKRGEVIGMPTETVYGLAGVIWNEAALARIFSTKDRPTFDPLIVHISQPKKLSLSDLTEADLIDLSAISSFGQDQLEKLIDSFWPGPLTLVLPKSPQVSDLATSGLPRVGIRAPLHPVAQKLIQLVGAPLAAPSANRFGRISPTDALAVQEELVDRIQYILDGGPCEVGVESTVLGLESNGEWTLLRPGGISQQALEKVLSHPIQLPSQLNTSPKTSAIGMMAPGMLTSHYAPAKPLTLLPTTVEKLSVSQISQINADLKNSLEHSGAPVGLLAFSGSADLKAKTFSAQLNHPTFAKSLSELGCFEEAARNLFSMLRDLDASASQVLFAEPSPSLEGLGHAIQDRLTRASKKP